jgi:hypothetical protein
MSKRLFEALSDRTPLLLFFLEPEKKLQESAAAVNMVLQNSAPRARKRPKEGGNTGKNPG